MPRPNSAPTASNAAITPIIQRRTVTTTATTSAPGRARLSSCRRDGSPRRRELRHAGGRLGLVLEGHDLPRRAIAQEGAHEPVVERVTRLEGAIGGEQRMADEDEVADRVEDLVLDELVVVAQALAVQHLELVDDDGVVEAAAERETARAHHLDVLGEAE